MRHGLVSGALGTAAALALVPASAGAAVIPVTIRKVSVLLALVDTAVVGNRAGDGAAGSNASGAAGTSPVDPGNDAMGGAGGFGGAGGGVANLGGDLALTRTRVAGNRAGTGGRGGDGQGGAGYNATLGEAGSGGGTAPRTLGARCQGRPHRTRSAPALSA